MNINGETTTSMTSEFSDTESMKGPSCMQSRCCRKFKRKVWGIKGKVASFFVGYIIICALIITIPGLVMIPNYFTKIELEEGQAILQKTPLMIMEFLQEDFHAMTVQHDDVAISKALRELAASTAAAGDDSAAVLKAQKRFARILHEQALVDDETTRFSSMKYVAYFGLDRKLLYFERHEDTTWVGHNMPINTTKEAFPKSFFNQSFVDDLLDKLDCGLILNFPGADTSAVTISRVIDNTAESEESGAVAGFAVWCYSILEDAQKFVDRLGECHSVTADLDNPNMHALNKGYFDQIDGFAMGGLLNGTVDFSDAWPDKTIIVSYPRSMFKNSKTIICPGGVDFKEIDNIARDVTVGYLAVRDRYADYGHPKGPGFTMFVLQEMHTLMDYTQIVFICTILFITIVAAVLYSFIIHFKVTKKLIALRRTIASYQHLDRKMGAKALTIKRAKSAAGNKDKSSNTSGTSDTSATSGSGDEIARLQDIAENRVKIMQRNLKNLSEELFEEDKVTQKNKDAMKMLSMFLYRDDRNMKQFVLPGQEGLLGKGATLEAIMEHPFAMEFFKTFCMRSGYADNIFFLQDVMWLRMMETQKRKSEDIETMCEKVRTFYMGEENKLLAKDSTVEKIQKAKKADVAMFSRAQKEVEYQLESKVLEEFKASLLFQSMVLCIQVSGYPNEKVLDKGDDTALTPRNVKLELEALQRSSSDSEPESDSMEDGSKDSKPKKSLRKSIKRSHNDKLKESAKEEKVEEKVDDKKEEEKPVEQEEAKKPKKKSSKKKKIEKEDA